MNFTKYLLDNLFASLERHRIEYCVLHGYETMPDSSPSDVDMTIDPSQEKYLDSLIYHLADQTGFTVTQKLYYDVPYCYYYVLCHASDNRIIIVQLDFLLDSIGINRYFFKSDELLKNRKRYKNFYVPEASVEAIYLLLKKVIKANITKEHQSRLKELYLQNKNTIEDKIKNYFGDSNLQITKNLISKDENISHIKLLALKRDFYKRNIKGIKRVLKLFWFIKRAFYRILNPTGMFVVILSPDGGGKTTVAKGMLEELKKSFRRVRYLYWRPTVLPELRDLMRLRFRAPNGRTNPDPHGRKKQNIIISCLRYFYYTFDFLLGYLKIRYLKTITTLVVMDRYYYDFMVDKIRYGFRAPNWLVKIISKVVPKPDLIIYLDNKPENIYQRKKELPIQELERQIEIFRKIIQTLPNAYTVNTDKPLNEVIYESSKIIIEKKAQNLKSHLRLRH